MRLLLLTIVLAIVVLIGGGLVFLGAFPPSVTPRPMVQTLPNDHFQTH